MTQQPRPTTRIKTIRKQQGLTLQKLADAVGTTPQTVCRLESGEMTVSMKWLLKFAEAFNVPLTSLMTDCAPANNPEDAIIELLRSELIRARRGPHDQSLPALMEANGKLAATLLEARMDLRAWRDVTRAAATVAACAIRIALDGEPGQVAQPPLALVREAG